MLNGDKDTVVLGVQDVKRLHIQQIAQQPIVMQPHNLWSELWSGCALKWSQTVHWGRDCSIHSHTRQHLVGLILEQCSYPSAHWQRARSRSKRLSATALDCASVRSSQLKLTYNALAYSTRPYQQRWRGSRTNNEEAPRTVQYTSVYTLWREVLVWVVEGKEPSDGPGSGEQHTRTSRHGGGGGERWRAQS